MDKRGARSIFERVGSLPLPQLERHRLTRTCACGAWALHSEKHCGYDRNEECHPSAIARTEVLRTPGEAGEFESGMIALKTNSLSRMQCNECMIIYIIGSHALASNQNLILSPLSLCIFPTAILLGRVEQLVTLCLLLIPDADTFPLTKNKTVPIICSPLQSYLSLFLIPQESDHTAIVQR